VHHNLNYVTHARRERDGRVRVYFAVAALNEAGLANVVTGEQAEAIAREIVLDLEDREGV